MAYRWVTGILGVVLLAAAAFIPMLSESPMGWGPTVVMLVTGGLGLDALISALRNTESFLSRIGPLP